MARSTGLNFLGRAAVAELADRREYVRAMEEAGRKEQIEKRKAQIGALLDTLSELDPQWSAWYEASVPEFSGWLSAECDEAVAVMEARVRALKDHNTSVRIFCPNCNQETDYTPFRTAAGITLLACACGECQDPEGSDNTLSGSLKAAGFGDFGPM
jgi:RNase P subunit RPR2